MYHLRLKIFIGLCISGLLVTVGRLLILQTTGVEEARQAIADQQILAPRQQPTIRGKILDRYDRPLAMDTPTFFLQIKYELTRYRDPRWREGVIRLRTYGEKTREQVEQECYDRWAEPMSRLNKAINLSNVLADVSEEDILIEIDRINDQVWKLARRVWWRRRNPTKSWDEYFQIRDTIPPEKIVTVDLWEMRYGSYPLIELTNDEDRLRAEVELLELKELQIKPLAKRDYPYGHSACQLIGWVGPVREAEMLPFEDEEYLRKYRTGELIGKAGLERIYEPVLRGRRGEIQKDIEGNIIKRIDPVYGKDVKLTLDIDLQMAVEEMLTDPTRNISAHKNCAAVVLEAASNDILAVVSTPTFDLNTIRLASNYNRVFNDPNAPMLHRALEKNFPPGSTAKPLILVAGIEEKKIGPNESISCSHTPPKGFPRCLTQYRFPPPHDLRWTNNGRNAIRGSCNMYFSKLANRIDRGDLQDWLFEFGYGRKILPTPLPDDLPLAGPFKREIKQAHGNLTSTVQRAPFTDSWDLPIIKNIEKRYWGIGQRSLRATVLQVANAL
ncbi:MAG: penicillin-binding transpeptidase domain-containing protein [Planctomycetota bacterium]|jgi:cell division protein FtsI/penicillin-binding protein 2